MSSEPYYLSCPQCRIPVANIQGGVAIVAYAQRVYVARDLRILQCECGGSVPIPGHRSLRPHRSPLPADLMAADNLRCPTPGCNAVLGQRGGDFVVVIYRRRVFVCRTLITVDCDQCHQWHYGDALLHQALNDTRVRDRQEVRGKHGVLCAAGAPA